MRAPAALILAASVLGCGSLTAQIRSDSEAIAERCLREAVVATSACTARVLREEMCRTARAQGIPEPPWCARVLPTAPSSQPGGGK